MAGGTSAGRAELLEWIVPATSCDGAAPAMNRRMNQWHHDRNQMAGRTLQQTLGADGQLVEIKDEVTGT
jgi:hypothetical protein